ncbi:MAG: peptidoglycan glycosyltransferase [Clostridia bacterium]|nr:peptidoglycan glycosyltransferase [Clostridia bacterium]
MKKIDKKSITKEYRQGTKSLILLVIIGCLFLTLGIHITVIETMHKDDYMNHSANQRQWITEQSVLRGSFIDRNGLILAHSESIDNEQVRIYDFGSLYAHIIGYSSRTYGKSQLEFSYNKYLSGMSDVTDIAGNFVEEKRGDTIQLTIDNDLQSMAQKMLNGKNGAVVAIKPDNGEILCMYSNPSFDPNRKSLETNWNALVESEKSPFLSRATSGLYAPGSVFKTIMLAAALEQGYEDYSVYDNGTLEIGDKIFENQGKKAYGQINLKEAYMVSSNVAFMKLGVEMGPDIIREYSKKFGIGLNNFQLEIPYKNGNFNYSSKLPDGEIALMSIGQGETLVTPLQMAVMTATIANDGIYQEPHLIAKITNTIGFTVDYGNDSSSSRVIKSSTANTIKEYMTETVERGTGTTAKIPGIIVGGKTGTAENETDGKEHTWFIGFAPAENPEIAVAVICEYSGGSGSQNSAPIAREIIKTWLYK